MERGAKGKGTESGKYEGEKVRKDKVERSGERSRGQDEEEKYVYNILLTTIRSALHVDVTYAYTVEPL